ncbi:MAG: DUF5615 family PIN-like protein [Chloroflexi bacterium]|nr:DUF5615 family PIN-like protein [Chloroflexota bacterium]
MAELRLLADMNLSPKTVAALRSKGMDILRVSELLPVTAPDDEVLALARQEARTLITQDLDFSSLVALGGHTRPSLITLRLSSSDPETATRRLLAALPELEEDLRRGCAVTVDDATVRIRKLPIH